MSRRAFGKGKQILANRRVTEFAVHRQTNMKANKSIGLVVGLTLIASAGMAFSHLHAKKTTVNGVGWYASFSDALVEAKQTDKPILLLSMFGHLDEDMPCANARTLRATLFKDPEFKKLVTDDVIPAWEMVRAVPRIQIDFGDGKKITRTVRGNAVMYLVNPEGKVVDAFPGVYTSHDFIPAIRESIAQLAHADAETVIAYHKERGAMIPLSLSTGGKAAVESPTLALIGAKPFAGAVSTYKAESPAQQKFAEAARRISDLSLTPMSPDDVVRKITGSPLAGRNMQDVAYDILRTDSNNNMVRMRPVIHLWLASESDLPSPEKARDVVLETILKIPFKDPYFGLRDVVLPGTPQ